MKSSLDIGSKAIDLRDALVLEIADVIASFDYLCATGGAYAPSDDEVREHDIYIGKIRECVKALNVYINTYENFDGS